MTQLLLLIPNITSEYLNKLIEEYLKDDKRIIATNYENGGVPAIFDKHYFSELAKYRGDKGANVVIMENKEDVKFLKPDFDIKDYNKRND